MRRPRRKTKTTTSPQPVADDTNIVPQTDAATAATVDTTTAPNQASADAAISQAGITPAELGPLGVGDAAPSSVVTNSGDIATVPNSDAIAKLAQSAVPATHLSTSTPDVLVPIANPASPTCNACGAQFASMTMLVAHIRDNHRTETSAMLTTPVINEAIRQFLAAWEGLHSLSPDVTSQSLTTYLDNTIADSPMLIIEDAGLCTSFMLSEVIPTAGLQRELIGFSWFMEMYQMVPPFPEGAVNRIVCHTNWAAKATETRNIEVRLPPPTDSCVSAYKTVLSHGYLASSQFNPLAFRSNVLLMLAKFVLSNLSINKSSQFTNDVTTLTSGRNIRVFEDDPQMQAVAYPGRAVLQTASKNANFLRTAIPERIGRLDRANLIQGEVSAVVECMELCDTLTYYIRELYHALLRSMHQDPTRVIQIINESAQNLLATSIPVALRPMILCPWFASTADLQLQQVVHLVNISTNTAAAAPHVEAMSSLLRAITPLKMDPTILTNAISNISESTTQTVSPITEILRLLRPAGNDYSAFWTCVAAWPYNGMVTTVLADDAFPANSQSITHLPSMWKALLIALAAPMTSDPHAAVKAFMTLANLLAQPEQIAINVLGMHQTTPVTQFNNPGVWPPGFINPNLLNPAQTPLLRRFADLIHRHWPQPRVFPFGSEAQGSANLFIDQGQMVYPWPHNDLPRMTIRPTYDSAMSVWINEVLAFYTTVVNAPIMAASVNEMTRRTITGIMTAMRQVKTMTPFYIESSCPAELAVLGATVLVPPLQVPFTRLQQQEVIMNVLVSRVDPAQRGDAAVDLRASASTFAAALPIDPSAVVVAMLCGTTDPTLIPSHHYSKAVAPLFTSNSIFVRNQRAVITREAYVCARSIVAQCTDDNALVPRPLNALRQFNVSASAAADIWTSVNNMFKEAFDISGALLDGISQYGDPRIADLSVALFRYNQQDNRIHVPPSQSYIHRALQVTESTFMNEMNLFNVAHGDVMLSQRITNGNWTPLANVLPIIVPGGPNVRTVGRHGMIVPRPGGLEPQLVDDAGNPQDIEGDWIYPIAVLQTSIAVFREYVWPMIQAGRTNVLLQLGHYLFTTHYHDPSLPHNESARIEAWFDTVTPAGVGPFPFSVPIPQISETFTARRVYYAYTTAGNNESLFTTNAAAIATRFGEDANVDPQRWPALVDPNHVVGTNQLPNRIELYSALRRYNYTYPSLDAIVYMNAAV
ncbi:VP3 [Marbled eel reovirus]|nr:VP3 [Marbled eel reovirus]